MLRSDSGSLGAPASGRPSGAPVMLRSVVVLKHTETPSLHTPSLHLTCAAAREIRSSTSGLACQRARRRGTTTEDDSPRLAAAIACTSRRRRDEACRRGTRRIRPTRRASPWVCVPDHRRQAVSQLLAAARRCPAGRARSGRCSSVQDQRQRARAAAPSPATRGARPRAPRPPRATGGVDRTGAWTGA